MGGRGGSGPRAAAAEPAAAPAPAAPDPSTLPLDNPGLANKIMNNIGAMVRDEFYQSESGWVLVKDLRDRLGVDRGEFDKAIRQLSRRREITTATLANAKAYGGQATVQDGVLMGGEFRGLVRIA